MWFWPIGVAIVTICLVSPAMGQSLKSGEVLSSIALRPISEPSPVLGADGRVHLAFELEVANTSRLFMTIDKVEAVDSRGTSLWLQEGDALAAMMTNYAGEGRKISPGGTAIVFMDVNAAPTVAFSNPVSVRVTATRELQGPDGKPKPFPATGPLPAVTTFTGAETFIGAPARSIEPPLRGEGWIAVNGCCDTVTSHRGAVMAVNGTLRVPERFAIDWIKLDETGRIYTGDPSKLASYAYYGTIVHAVADGVVVNMYNDAEEQIPGEDAKGITTENIGGNMLVIDIGGGAFAFYAHLQRNSLKVGLGDRVTAGQPIGLLGNTGNSTAPHLHFHLMDGPSPLDANGLPYVFKTFSSRGVVMMDGNDDPIEKGQPATIDGTRLAGQHKNELPLNNQLVDFGD